MTALSWVGLGGDNKLSTATNLSPAQVPVAGDSIDFPAAATGLCDWDMNEVFLSVSSDVASNIAITQTKKASFSGSFTINGTGGTTWDQNSLEIEAAGYSDIGSAIVTLTSNTFRAIGSSSTSLASSGNDLHNVIVQKPSGVLTLQTGYNILGTLTLDCTGGNQTIGNPVITMTINKIVCIGTGAFVTTWGDAFNALNITVTDTDGVLEFVDINNIIISGGPLFANSDNSSDLGGSSGITFVAPIVWDDTGSGSLASTGSNWVGNVAPGVNDIAQWDATAVTDCTWDIAAIGIIDVQAAYSGIVTQSVLVVVENGFTINGSDTTPWVTAGNNLDLKGNVVTGGAGNGLVHNAGGIVRFGANVDIDKGDLDSNCELFDFTGSGVRSVFRFTVGSTELPDLFTIRSGCQMRIFSNSSFMNVQVDSGGSITDNNVVTQLTLRGNLTTTDIVGAIISTVPGNLTMAYNSAQMPGGDYGTANVQTTSAAVVLQGNVSNINMLIVYRTFTAAPGMLTSNGFSIACVNIDVGSPTQVSRGGVLELESGSSFTCDGVLNINQTDGLQDHESIVDVQAGAGPISIGGLNVEALAELDMSASNTDLEISDNILISATAVISAGQTTITKIGSGAQTIDAGGKTLANVALRLSGGSLTWIGNMVLSGRLAKYVSGSAYDVILPVAGTHSVNALLGRGGANEATLKSDTAGVKVTLTVATQGPINLRTKYKDLDIAGSIVRCDLPTCDDLGNNTLAGAVGLDFDDFILAPGPLSKSLSQDLECPLELGCVQ